MPKPKMKAADRRSVILMVRVTKAEGKRLRAEAKTFGYKLSELLRKRLLG